MSTLHTPAVTPRTAVALRDVVKRFRGVNAVDGVSFDLQPDTITGLLGRNGAGKSTLLRLIAGHTDLSSGALAVFGQSPYENDAVLERVCFMGERLSFPENYRVCDALAAARIAFPTWDDDLAQSLLEAFSLPARRQVRRLSRGMLSAVSITLGLASRAPLTLLDEPYLGLDAVARRTFYDRLLADFADHPRTVVLSTHLIDEVSDLLEHVVLIDKGRVVIDEEAENLRGSAVLVTGPTPVVEAFAAAHETLRLETLATFTKATLRGVDAGSRDLARGRGLSVETITLQDLVVDLTMNGAPR